MAAGMYVALDVTGYINSVAVPMMLVYCADEPMAVTLQMDPEDRGKDWVVARGAFAEAMAFRPFQDSGAHDILVRRVGPTSEIFEITLMPHRSDKAVIRMTTDSVRRFLRMSHSLVPLGPDNEAKAIDWSAAEQALGLDTGQLSLPDDPRK